MLSKPRWRRQINNHINMTLQEMCITFAESGSIDDFAVYHRVSRVDIVFAEMNIDE